MEKDSKDQTEQLDELIEEMKAYDELIKNNAKKEKTKIFKLDKTQEIDFSKIEEESSKEETNKTDEPKLENIQEKDNQSNDSNNKKKNTIIYILIGIVVFLIIVVLIVILNFSKNNEEVESNIDSDVLTKTEYTTILKNYSEAVELAVTNYMENNNKKVPSFEDIEKSIYFPNYKISCTKSLINYDGSIYLNDCLIKGYSNKFKFNYGEEKASPKESKNKIYIYHSHDNVNNVDIYFANSIKMEEDNNHLKLITTYNCENEKCKGYGNGANNNKNVIIYDDKYYLFDAVSLEKQELPGLGTKEYERINLVTDKNNRTVGLFASKKASEGAYYLLNKNKFVTDFEYQEDTTTNTIATNGYFAAIKSKNNTNNIFLLHQVTGEVIKTFKNALYIQEETIGSTDLFFVRKSFFGDKEGYFLNSEYNKLIKSLDSYTYAVNSDNTITIPQDKNFKVYNTAGDEISTSKDYKKIEKVLKDYVVVSNDNNVDVLDYQDNYLATLFEANKNYKYHPQISGWYDNGDKKGVFFVVENTKVPVGSVGRGLEYFYVPETKEVGVINTEGIGGYAKPVLYLYPKHKQKVTVKFSSPEKLTTTYPKYNKNWTVTANKNGDLYDKFGKYYYGLYWEEDGSNDVDFQTGFYVEKDNAIEFLDDITEKIGFTRREANEFIMYWLPIIEKNEKNLIYFEFTKERDSFNKLNISPKPDSLLRVAIHVKKVDRYTYIKEEAIPKFNRKGFAAVEWGGVVH